MEEVKPAGWAHLDMAFMRSFYPAYSQGMVPMPLMSENASEIQQEICTYTAQQKGGL
jgi:hypothetical protein